MQDVSRLDGSLNGPRSLGIGCTNDLPGPDASTSHQHGKRVPPVIATGAAVDFRRSTEFTHDHHNDVVQQSSLFEVFDQRRDGRIHSRGVAVPHGVFDGAVIVPAAGMHRDEFHAGLNQPPGQQRSLADRVASVAVPQPSDPSHRFHRAPDRNRSTDSGDP